MQGLDSQYEIKKWSYISKWRRDYKLFQRLGNIKDVSRIFGEDISLVEKNLKGYALIRYILDIPEWTDEERGKLSDNNLKTSILQRNMSSEVLELLGVSFDDNFNVTTSIESDKFQYLIAKLTRSMFLQQSPIITTRTDSETLKKFIDDWIEEWNKNKSQNKDGSPGEDSNKGDPSNSEDKSKKSTGRTPKPNGNKKSGKLDHYFKSLYASIKVQDQRLNRLTYELRHNNMKDRPASGVLLVRSLIESALLYRIESRKLTEKLIIENKGLKLEEIRLNRIIHFSLIHVEELFSKYKEAEKSLKMIQKDHLSYMNSIVHGSWLDPTPGALQNIAGDTRELLRTILSDSP